MIFLLAGVLFCVWLYLTAQNSGTENARHTLFYLSFLILDGGMLCRTLLNRKENVSAETFGYKLAFELILFLSVVAAYLRVVFFP